ncbi:MAG: nuclear transport factor 2 family protein [Planctomycetes bacterium]|nr:nuclear transport factor 2 family protein [Planctomycetota bacterium]
MTKTSPLLLALALLAVGPALADWPTHYTLTGAKGVTGTLELADAGETLLRKREKLDVRLTFGATPETQRELKGTLTLTGDVFRGGLRSTAGLDGRVLGRHASPPWQVELSQGLQLRVRLQRAGKTVTLSGSAPVGARNAANEETIRRFYGAFQRKDAAVMAEQYAPDVHFSDRVFPDLRGAAAGSMWAMLCESEDLRVTFSGVRAGERYGVARWEADYTVFGNPVHNVIDANFEFDEAGEIVRHVDSFDFERWSSQALPGPARFVPSGVLISTIRAGLAVQLHRFRRKQSAAPQ